MVSTCPSNATKRVAQVVLDAKQKRRTPAQIQEDNASIQRGVEEQAAKAQKSIQRVAIAQEKLANQQNSASRRPRPRSVGKKAAEVVST